MLFRSGSSGTPAFAPPEQLLAEQLFRRREQLLGEQQGVAADLFAVAAIVYYALAGEPPFPGTDGRAILAMQLAGKTDLSRFDPEIAAWIRKGLSADPDQRFTDAAEMQREWRRVTRSVLQDENRPSFGSAVSGIFGRLFGRN